MLLINFGGFFCRKEKYEVMSVKSKIGIIMKFLPVLIICLGLFLGMSVTAYAGNAYLTFTGTQEFTISASQKKWNGTLEYSTDASNWTTWNKSDDSVISSSNKVLYLRGTGNSIISDRWRWTITTNGTVDCSGDIRTLLGTASMSMSGYCFSYMFSGCTSLTTAPELPATSLTEDCYEGMFSGCTGLTTAPNLPATSLASECYEYMFSGCTGLTTAPNLPATSLASHCY